MEVADVKLLEELLIKEGIIYDPYSAEIDFEPAYEDLTSRTITMLQQTVEELSSTVDKLKRENKALKDIVMLGTDKLNVRGEDVEGDYYEKVPGLFSSLYSWVFRSMTTLLLKMVVK
ncbi:hypothetical protein MKW94_023128 [Papaver nudicaule]|uniref:Uncharacterized protein n=1 Tax=Papaver nudicaule TaxID=74823 RepID=A0AA41RQV5_PAPNU|nr:hypothetical protein [Papaver nudicaule]